MTLCKKHKVLIGTLGLGFLIFIITYISHSFIAALMVVAVYVIVAVHANLICTRRQLSVLYNMALTITSTLDVDKVLDKLFYSASTIAPWDSVCLYIYHNGWMIPIIYEGSDEQLNLMECKLKLDERICGKKIFNGEAKIINSCHKDKCIKRLSIFPSGTKSILAVPLVNNNELIGGICLTSNCNNIYSKRHLTLLGILASQSSTALSNAYLFDKTLYKAVTDELTGLYNRNYIYAELEEQKRISDTSGSIFSLIMIDVDYFKKYNDVYGHAIGDAILKNLAELLKQNVRDEDSVGRYGGEEFIIILPGISSLEAMRIAERIRCAVENTAVTTVKGEKLYITISAGISSYPADAKTLDDLINKADKALLYGAKQEGRNKVVLFRPNLKLS